ncbi:hypothetical protein M3Y99_01098000 [Aphelenchoides fujianensis]|nr:hypothetical protein M3Y99_01098000 [Aphelenchoides fujianensis]
MRNVRLLGRVRRRFFSTGRPPVELQSPYWAVVNSAVCESFLDRTARNLLAAKSGGDLNTKSAFDAVREEIEQLNQLEQDESADDSMRAMIEKDRESLKESLEEAVEPPRGRDRPRRLARAAQQVPDGVHGAGGIEAMMFTNELIEMYEKFCQRRGWTWTIFEYEGGQQGGARSALVSIEGDRSYSALRFEAGVHRVQRIPMTDKSRMHTSTASVSVLPEPEEAQVEIPSHEVQYEAIRASGPGGQNVNKRSSAVRLTHLPTGIAIAFKRLGAILLQQKVDALQTERTSARRLQVGSKARAEKVRTYNFQADRITDHRLKTSTTGVAEFMDGGHKLEHFVDELGRLNRLERLTEIPDDPKKPTNPIVLIPGDGGSRLLANLTGKPDVVHYLCDRTTADYFDLWLNLESFVPIAIDCWADNMKLVFDNSTKRSADSPGVDIKVPFFGATEGVEWLDPSQRSPGRYFQPLVDALVSWGYTRGKNLVGRPYDWRRSPAELNEYYLMLRLLITTVYRYNNHQKVINYVDQKWKDTYIQTHISLAGAWGGAMQIVKLYASGYNMDYLPCGRCNGSFTSSAFLFPSTHLWAKDEPLAITFERNYTLADLEDFFRDVGYPIGMEQYKMANPALRTEAPGIPVHCVYGHDVNTPELLTWAKGYFPDYQPVITYGDGDGTVNRRSLELCKEWRGKNNGRLVTIHELSNADHIGILGDLRTIQLVKDILYNQ